MSEQAYAGDVGPSEAWRILAEDPAALLVDVRTDAEWNFVGLPDLGDLGKQTLCVAWQIFPAMALNQDFSAELEAKGVTKQQPLLLICRSGVRSRHAAIALTQAGYGPCYNVADGFEGGHDEAGHRGRTAGWKAEGLPWAQG
ncbi:MAG: rhodanese-like domain-containing protein [Rhodospirillales bacterium]|nr:rhodanese-like domain-containing protein [Rhodospirillales bacterium]